jgi:hypothetical protein
MELVRAVFGIALLTVSSVAVVLGMAIVCLYEARLIKRLVHQLAPATTQPDAACRATCDR